MNRAVFFCLALSTVLSATPMAWALDVRGHGLDTPAPVTWIGRLDGAATVRLGADQYFTVGLDAQGITLAPRPAPLPPAPSGDAEPMPDEVVARGDGTIQAAWYRKPTDRYTHGVLGDAIEAGGLAIRTADGAETLTLPTEAVFEDIAPRIVDLDGDGVNEVLCVKSYLDGGAALALIEPSDRGLRVDAESEPFGRPFRWLNPVGVGDFDGDGKKEVAVVVTPHIGGILRLYEWRDERLEPDGEAQDFSNHVAGTRELGLATQADVNGDGVPDLIVPDNGRTGLRLVTFAGGKFAELAKVTLPEPVTLTLIAQDLDGDGRPEIILAPGGHLMVLDFPK